MKKYITPNTAYFKPVLFTDPTFGHTYPVYLLRSNDTQVFFTSIPVYLTLFNTDSLLKIRTYTFVSPYKTIDFNSMIELDRDQLFFSDAIDLNWFFFEDCLSHFSEDKLVISFSNLTSRHNVRKFYFELPNGLKSDEISEHLNLLHIFSSFFYTNEPVYGKREVDFLTDFINDPLDLFFFFPEHAFFYLDQFFRHFSEKQQVKLLLFDLMFSSNSKDQKVYRVLRTYQNRINK